MEDKLCDHREDHVEDQEIKLENKEEQLNQLKETLEAKEKRKIRAREKDRLKRTKTALAGQGRTDDKEQRLAERFQELREGGGIGYRVIRFVGADTPEL